MPDWIISNAERQELEHLSTRLGEIITNLRQRPAETTPMPPPPGLGQHLANLRTVVHPDHAPFCDGTCVRYGRDVNCPDPDGIALLTNQLRDYRWTCDAVLSELRSTPAATAHLPSVVRAITHLEALARRHATPPTDVPPARVQDVECEEHDHDRYGDCEGPVTEFEQIGTLYGKVVGSRVNLCASHARQAGMRGAVRWTINS